MGTEIHLTPELEQFTQACVGNGRFNSVGDVVRSALRLLKDAEERRAAFVSLLKDAVEEGRCQGFLTANDVEQDVLSAIQGVCLRKA